MEQQTLVWQNAIVMLKARGYDGNIQSVCMPPYTALVAMDNTRDRKILMVMDNNDKVGIHTIRYIISELNNDIHYGVLIIRSKITPFARQAIDTYNHSEDRGHIEVFTFSNLHINICKHKYTPEHYILTQEETEDVLKKYEASRQVFPKLSAEDPLTRYYGLTSGQVAKFVRKYGYDRRVVYRVVV